MLKKIDRIVEQPTDPDFLKMKFADVVWPNEKSRNFYFVLRDLFLNGESTLKILSVTFLDNSISSESAYSSIYRLINGSTSGNVIGLINHGLVVKNGFKFRLSMLGVLYMMYCFRLYKSPYFLDGNTKNIFTQDFSCEVDYKDTILSVALKHYSDYFPFLTKSYDSILACPSLSIINILTVLCFHNNTIVTLGDSGLDIPVSAKKTDLEYDQTKYIDDWLNYTVTYSCLYYALITSISRDIPINITDPALYDMFKKMLSTQKQKLSNRLDSVNKTLNIFNKKI